MSGHWIGGERLIPFSRQLDELDDVNDPLHNLREIAKQLLLLEGHLFDPGKQCGSCIEKHLLTVEALFEEAVSLDPDGELTDVTSGSADAIRALLAAIEAGELSATETGQILREARRTLLDQIDVAKKNRSK